ncbi:MAG: transglycosylase SLT domain-containing protein [Alphaproteobacteria bacterium]|nr:transglycosylase SLT domain-containing protein [Alphaproteobacteria bacterium]
MLLALLLWSSSASASPPADVQAAFAVGDCRTAVAALPSPTEDAERLALARCRVRMGEEEAALAGLLAIRDEGLAPFVALVRGEALVALGKGPEAAEALAGAAGLDGPAGRMARYLRGRALVEAGDWTGGRDALNSALVGELADAGALPGPGEPDPGAIRWWLAQGAIRRGEPDKATGVMGSLWARNPSSEWAGPAEAWLTGRGVDLAGLTDDTARALTAERADTFDVQRRYGDALGLRDRLGVSLTPGQEAAAAFKAKDYPRAVAAYARVASPTPSQRFQHALATSRTGDYAAAAALYQALIDAAPGSPQADEASYKLGYLAYDAGELERAVPLFDAHLRRYPATAHGLSARWFRAWALYKLDRLDDADAAFADVIARHGSDELAANATYWRARIKDRRGDAAGAQAGYRDVLARWHDSGAGFFAAERLGRRYALGEGARAPVPARLREDAHFQRGVALAEVGLGEWARLELAQVPTKGASTADRDAMADALALAGDYVGARALAHGEAGDWPRPQASVVGQITAASGLEPLLPFAIMNAESALKPWVTSIAGARGLMQMMPALAETHHVARFGPERPYDPDDLYLPGYNAALGTTELAALHTRFRDAGVQPSLPLVIAGYNGGAEAVERWLAAYPEPPDGDRFAEDVGYTETRRYVRRVLGYLQRYRRIHGTPVD